MLRRFRDPSQMAYFPCHDNILKNKWVLFRGVAFDIGLSSQAREKLEWIIFFNTVGERNVTKTALYFGISRKTLHKWLGKFKFTPLEVGMKKTVIWYKKHYKELI